MAQERLGAGGSGGTSEAEEDAEQAMQETQQEDAPRGAQRAVEQTPESNFTDVDQDAINEAFGAGGSESSRPTGTASPDQTPSGGSSSGSQGGSDGSSGGGSGGDSRSSTSPDADDLNPEDFGADTNRSTTPTRTGGSGNELSDAEQQNVNAAVADVNPRARREQQGVETQGGNVGKQARELEKTVLERNPELSSEDIRVVRDGRQIRTELTPQGAERVGANPTTGEVRRRVASQNENVDADDIVVRRTESGEFDVSLSDRRDRQQSGGRDVSPFISRLNVDIEPGPRSQDIFSTDVLGTSGTRTGALRARTPRASAGESFSTTTLGADDEVGVSVADLDSEVQQRVNSAFVGSFSARTTVRTRQGESQEEEFLNDLLGGAPDAAQSVEQDLFGGLREDADRVGREFREGAAELGTDIVGQKRARKVVGTVEDVQQFGDDLEAGAGNFADDVSAEVDRQVTAAERDVAELDVDTDQAVAGVSTAAAAGVVAPEPVSTVGGGAVLGGVALAGIAGAAATGAANDLLDDDGDGSATSIGTGDGLSGSELDVPQEGTTVVQSELDVSDGPVFGSELGVGSGNFQRNEISVPDRGFSGTSGEINVPALGASQLSQQIRRGRQRERQREREDNPFRRDPGGADEDELEEILRGPGEVTIEEEERLEESRDQTVRRDRERFTERRLNELRASEEETNQSPEERFREAERSSVVGRAGPQAGSRPVTGVGADQQAGVQSDVDADVLSRADVTQVQRQLQLQDQTQVQRQQQALRLAQPQSFADTSLTTTVNSGEFVNPNEFIEVTENATGRPGGDGGPRGRRARLDFDAEQDFGENAFSGDIDSSLQINPVTAPDELDDALRLDGGD